MASQEAEPKLSWKAVSEPIVTSQRSKFVVGYSLDSDFGRGTCV